MRTATSLAQTLGLPAAGVVVSLLAVRTAGITTWGAFVGALVLVQLAAQIANFGARDHLLRAFSREPAAIAAIWQRNVATRALLLPSGPLLFLVFGASPVRAAWMTAWLLALFIAQSHDAPVVYRRAFGFALGVELGGTLATVALILLVGSALSVDTLIVAFALVAWAKAVALALRFGVIRARGWLRAVDLGEFRRSWPFFVLTFTGAVQSRVDLYAVAALLPATEVGQYQVLTTFVLLGQAMSSALLAPVTPSLYRITRAAVLSSAARLLAVGVPLTLAAAVVTWLALELLYGIQLPAAVLALAWVAMLPAYLYLPLVYLCFREGRERFVVAANILGIGVALVGTVLLAPRLGVGGAMAAAAAAQVVIAAVHAWRALRAPGVAQQPTRDALSGV